MTVGREYNHPEDLVFLKGNSGIENVNDFFSSSVEKTYSIKYDGFVSIYWMWKNGCCFMATSNSYKKDIWLGSKLDVYKFIMSTGNGEPWREEHAREMTAIYAIISTSSFPCRDVCHADVLYSPHRPPINNKFKPNLVEYTSHMPTAVIGLAVHSGNPIFAKNVINYASHVEFDGRIIYHCKNIDSLDSFLEKRYGISDLRGLLYKYSNRCHKDLSSDFMTENGFLEWTSVNCTESKTRRIHQHCREFPGIVDLIFQYQKDIEKNKDKIIDILDSKSRPLDEHVNSTPGGEGYIVRDNKIKLVKRSRWRPLDEKDKRKF